MNDEQYKRYRKMNVEPIKCLYKARKNTNLYFLISGSSGTNYKVTVQSDGKISCSCPDFTHGSKDNRCICKHCLYVIYNVLRLFKSVEHTFFTRLYFTPDEVQEIQKIYTQISLKNHQ